MTPEQKTETLEEITERIATRYSLRGQKGQRAGLRFAILSALRNERESQAQKADKESSVSASGDSINEISERLRATDCGNRDHGRRRYSAFYSEGLMDIQKHTKTCEVCGVLIVKRRKEGFVQWNNRTTCSVKCQAIARKRRHDTLPQSKKCSQCLRLSPCKECKIVIGRVRYRKGPKRKTGKAYPIDPLKAKARREVSSAVRAGRLIPQPCSVCGAKAQAHHHDYTKPLEVEWLCTVHHGKEHWKPVSTPLLAKAEAELEVIEAIREGR